jgi:hypothetical protein
MTAEMPSVPRLVVLAVTLASSLARAGCPPTDHGHAAWTAILDRSVDAGAVDYASLARDDRELDAYLATLSATCAADYERWTRAERLAFWINAYNAFTVRLVLDHYPIASIRDVGWLPLAAFRRKFIPMPELKGGTISLDDIEHRTLRSAFREPRIHFALVCAARSCPALRAEAYRGADLDRQLDDQGRSFLRDAAKNRLDTAAKTLYLSSIFQWFRGDFEETHGSLWAFVAPYLGETATVPAPRIEFLDYDWRLNDRSTPKGGSR